MYALTITFYWIHFYSFLTTQSVGRGIDHADTADNDVGNETAIDQLLNLNSLPGLGFGFVSDSVQIAIAMVFAYMITKSGD